MFRPQIVTVLFTLALAFSSVKCSFEVFDSNELSIEKDFDERIPEPQIYPIPVPNVGMQRPRHMIENLLTKDVSPKVTIPYELGKRENGDRLILRYKSPKKESGTPFDVKQTEAFEFEATITFVRVVVEQSTDQGKISLTSGGTGQKNIGLQTEATRTLSFVYTTEIYGYY